MLSDSAEEDADSPEELSAQVQRILDSVEDNDPSIPRLSKYLQVRTTRARAHTSLAEQSARPSRTHAQPPHCRPLAPLPDRWCTPGARGANLLPASRPRISASVACVGVA